MELGAKLSPFFLSGAEIGRNMAERRGKVGRAEVGPARPAPASLRFTLQPCGFFMSSISASRSRGSGMLFADPTNLLPPSPPTRPLHPTAPSSPPPPTGSSRSRRPPPRRRPPPPRRRPPPRPPPSPSSRRLPPSPLPRPPPSLPPRRARQSRPARLARVASATASSRAVPPGSPTPTSPLTSMGPSLATAALTPLVFRPPRSTSRRVPLPLPPTH